MQKSKVESEPQAENVIRMRTVAGEVVREFEGSNVLKYGFAIPESATTSVEMDGALVKVKDTALYATVYMSYEGGRGYTAVDYLSAVVSPHVSVLNITDVEKIGNYDWQRAETEGSEWRVASIDGGKWLVVIENKKARHAEVAKIVESFEVN